MRYKFRQECSCDGPLFFGALGSYARNIVPETDAKEGTWAYSFDSNLPLTYLLEFAAGCVDCHVIEDTLQPEELFTIEGVAGRRAREKAEAA